jgi:polysaccharide biosynthesis protein PslH
MSIVGQLLESQHLENGRARSTSARRLNIAIVDEELPYPPTSGKRIRTLNLTKRLAERHHITYICPRNADDEEGRRAANYLNKLGIETLVVDRAAPPRSGPFFYARLLLNLFSKSPYSVTSHDSWPLRQLIHEVAATRAIDLWHCEWTPCAAALRDLPSVRKLIMAHNVESQIWQRYAETETNPLKRWYIRIQERKFKRFERWAVRDAHKTVAVSEEDACLFADQFDARSVSVVDNGVDIGYFQPRQGPREEGHILFLGSLDWRPNLDAVDMLLDRIFPAVLSQVPHAQLSIVGRNPSSDLARRVEKANRVTLHGNVADVRPYLNRCGVMAVPLRIGGGSRLKILEALACGLPVVSTEVGAEGLDLQPGKHLCVVAKVDAVAPALIDAIGNPSAMQAMADAGRQRVLERYDWDSLAKKLERIWFECAGK